MNDSQSINLISFHFFLAVKHANEQNQKLLTNSMKKCTHQINSIIISEFNQNKTTDFLCILSTITCV